MKCRGQGFATCRRAVSAAWATGSQAPWVPGARTRSSRKLARRYVSVSSRTTRTVQLAEVELLRIGIGRAGQSRQQIGDGWGGLGQGHRQSCRRSGRRGRSVASTVSRSGRAGTHAGPSLARRAVLTPRTQMGPNPQARRSRGIAGRVLPCERLWDGQGSAGEQWCTGHGQTVDVGWDVRLGAVCSLQCIGWE